MVKSWWDDAIKDDANADSMIHGFISWYRNPSSYLYDSSLHYHVHNLTKKSLAQVLGEFKGLGSAIVFADRNKIIIRTSKTQVENSYAYGQYAISSIRAKPLFNFLELGVVRYWDLLVWMDQYNYAGSYCSEIEEKGNEQQELEFVSKWQIKNFLPPALQDEFEDWVLFILDAFIKHRQADAKSSQSPQATPRRTQITQILKNNRFALNKKNADVEEDFSKGVSEYFRSPLLKRVKALISKQNETILDPVMAEDFKFPLLAGSHLNLTNPTLELVKCICHILSLSRRRYLEIRMLRKELLNLFDVKEFSDEGQFKNPSTSLILPQWVCDYCNHTRDVDICRDDEAQIWNCEACDKPFNKLIIEEKLIFQFTKLMAKFLTQDFKCSKCSRIRESELSAHCNCSGSWVSTISKKDIFKRLKVYINVSDAYQFRLLKDVTDELLDG
ncbi:unnamed protein product [Ambrosiozyma monospora]|uniref:DNA polymerase epsilon catalytic subunit n=1 Tax=Ambrosiozyma monospora TaxID=43982 RepID=A0A9W6YSK0_AMBMO|nr:unnamed protein product [Ambrosiozyma monospora]